MARDKYSEVLRPIRNKPFISFAIPSSIVSEAPDLREKTRKIGYIGRAAAIFRVEEILVYRDDDYENLKLVETILSYLETPPYLKRRLIPRNPLLRYAGILPPLKTPHHVHPRIFNTRYREGIVTSTTANGSIVDIGLDKQGLVPKVKLRVGSRVTVKVKGINRDRYILELVDRESIDIYWGYKLETYNSMEDMLREATRKYDVVIGATKKGEILYNIEKQLMNNLVEKNKVLIVFGGPKHDIDEIASKEGVDIKEYCDYLVNFIPRQGVESVRTEEAILIVLGIINYLKEKYLLNTN